MRSVSTLNFCATSFVNSARVWTLKPIARVVATVSTSNDDDTIVVAPLVAIVLPAVIMAIIEVSIIVIVVAAINDYSRSA